MRKFEIGKPWYRATINVTHQIDAPVRASLNVVEVEVLRITDRGAWVRSEYGEEKWLTSQTHWCSPTQEGAIESLRIRKARHVGHARRRLEDAEFALAYLDGNPSPSQHNVSLRLT